MQTSEETSAPSLAVTCVRSLLERHGLPRYRQSAWLANAVGLSYSQAHRRLNGTSPWSLEDLAQVAKVLGESLVDLLTQSEPQSAVNAVLRTGTKTLHCRLWLGEAITTPTSVSVFAVKSRSGWIVATADDEVEGEAFRIDRLEARPAMDGRHAVAVLDDDPGVTDSIVASFEYLGYSAHPFYNAHDLLRAAATRTFDCFVLDWVIDDDTVLEAVRTLRAADRQCPIVILTAQMASAASNEQDIADAMKHYDLLFCEKPVRTSILAAMLSRALASRPDRGNPALRG